MQVWGPEGFASIDFAKRHLTLMQPAAHLRSKQGKTRQNDPATLASYKAELFTRHLQTLEVDCAGGDQLTAELAPISCNASAPARRRALTEWLVATPSRLASLILDSLRSHQWEGDANGPSGPWNLPAPMGPLFMSGNQQAAA